MTFHRGFLTLLLQFFPAVVDGAVDVVEKRLASPENVQDSIGQIGGEDEVFVKAFEQAEILQFKEFSVRAVGRKPFRDLLQGVSISSSRPGARPARICRKSPPPISISSRRIFSTRGSVK